MEALHCFRSRCSTASEHHSQDYLWKLWNNIMQADSPWAHGWVHRSRYGLSRNAKWIASLSLIYAMLPNLFSCASLHVTSCLWIMNWNHAEGISVDMLCWLHLEYVLPTHIYLPRFCTQCCSRDNHASNNPWDDDWARSSCRIIHPSSSTGTGISANPYDLCYSSTMFIRTS